MSDSAGCTAIVLLVAVVLLVGGFIVMGLKGPPLICAPGEHKALDASGKQTVCVR